VINTPEDEFSSHASVHTVMNIIEKNSRLQSVEKNGKAKKVHHA
jgi:hypothetical protein